MALASHQLGARLSASLGTNLNICIEWVILEVFGRFSGQNCNAKVERMEKKILLIGGAGGSRAGVGGSCDGSGAAAACGAPLYI